MSDKTKSHQGGILTDRDRQYLKGKGDDLLTESREEMDIDSNHERVIRSDIRERVERALVDLSLLFRYLDDDDFAQLGDQLPWGDPSEEAIGFIYRYEKNRRTPPGTSLETRIRGGVREAAQREGNIADVDISIEQRAYDRESLIKKPTEELSEAEISVILRDEEVGLDFIRRDDE